MSTELEEALLGLIYVSTCAAGVVALYVVFAFFRMIAGTPSKIELSPSKVELSGGTTVTENSADNYHTERAANKSAEGVIEAARITAEADVKVAEIQLKIENSQRERAELPPI